MPNLYHDRNDSRTTARSPRSQARLLLVLAPILLLAFAASNLPAVHNFLDIDVRLSALIREGLSHNLTQGSHFLYSLCDLQIWDTAVLLLAATLWLKRYRMEATLLALGLTIDIAAELVKAAQTPVSSSGSLFADILAAANAGSFPSGHVARTSVSLGLIVALFLWASRRWRIWAILIAAAFLVAVGAVSIRSGGHTASDILGGYILAALWVDVLLLLRTAASMNQRARGPRPEAAPRDGPDSGPQ
jgi:membrane-associated phospholipid phosphatase